MTSGRRDVLRQLAGGAVAMAAGTPAQAATPAATLPAIRRLYLDTPGGQVHARRVDPQHGGAVGRPALLCFHQVPNSSQTFGRWLAQMGTDRTVLALDTPGYGHSDPIPGSQRIEDYAGRLLQAAEPVLSGPLDLFGYHTGAAIACDLAGRLRERVRHVVLCAVPVFSAQERAQLGALTPIPFDLEGDWVREEWRRTVRWRGPGQDDASLLRSFAEKLRPGARERGAQAIAAYDMAAAVQSVRQPLMIVRPRDDLWEATARARALRPDAAYVELPDYGHGLFDVAPEAVSVPVRAFLDR